MLVNLIHLEHILPYHGLLESILNYVVLRHLPKQISEISFLLDVIFNVEEVVLFDKGRHLNLLEDEI